MNNPTEKFETEDAPAKRGKGRDSLFLNAVLRFPPSEAESEVRVRNLSEGGLMAETKARVAKGDPVEVNLRTIGWISGHVAWTTDGRIGIAFDHSIDPKAARKPVGTADLDLPPHLRKLNNPSGHNKFRRL